MGRSSKKGGGASKGRRSPSPRGKPAAGRKPRGSRRRPARADDFREAFASLLRSRGMAVPDGLAEAPPEAYASQSASIVEQLASLPDADLERYAEKVATFAERQRERARTAWEGSPLIAELRKRGLEEPETPRRVVGVSVSLAKPLAEWSDKEILRAARDWSRLAR